jgi:hypothetical protein
LVGINTFTGSRLLNFLIKIGKDKAYIYRKEYYMSVTRIKKTEDTRIARNIMFNFKIYDRLSKQAKETGISLGRIIEEALAIMWGEKK